MKKKIVILSLILLGTAVGFGQDTSASVAGNNRKEQQDTMSHTAHAGTGISASKSNPAEPHYSVNLNTGTAPSNTTSGTLNSPVNPNTQLVIPINKARKKLRLLLIPVLPK